MQLPKHVPQLDVLRGVAVLVVMFHHVTGLAPSLHLDPIVRMGYTGVDLFFVLSGFLITGILVRSKDQPGYFRNFYARRVLRIWPIYYALLLFTFLLLPFLAPTLKNSIFGLSHPWQSFFFFVQNLFAKGQSAFDTVRVTWSLAIEEQFYLAWPVIVWLVPRRSLKSLALSAVLVSIGVRWAVLYGLIPPIDVYTNSITRLDGLGMGAFLALWIPEADTRVVKYAGFAVPTAVLALGVIGGWFNPAHYAFYTAVALCFAGMLCAAINLPGLSNFSALRYTGKISYCLYLIHVPIIQLMVWARKFLPLAPSFGADIAMLVAAFALCFVLASLSWKYFESRVLRLKSHFEYSYAGVPPPVLDPSVARQHEAQGLVP
jgi:peptidoglycan/LPS O-acetylase OafA/YrhL